MMGLGLVIDRLDQCCGCCWVDGLVISVIGLG